MDAKRLPKFRLPDRIVRAAQTFATPAKKPPGEMSERPKSLHETPLSPQAKGEIGELMAAAEMLRHGIIACEPRLDVGVDIFTCYQKRVIKRVQIKAQLVDEKVPGKLTFAVTRRKVGSTRNGTYVTSPAKSYSDEELDAFIFVHIELRRFFIVPAARVTNKYKITLDVDSEWADAWYVLQTP